MISPTCFLLAIIVIGYTVSGLEITYTRYKDARSISTGPNDFSISDKQHFEPEDCMIAEVSQRLITFYSSDCNVTMDSIGDLTNKDHDLVERAYKRAYGDDILLSGQDPIEPEIYTFFDDNRVKFSRSGSENFVSYYHEGYAVFMFDEKNFSVAKTNLPDELARIFVDNETVGFVKLDGQILMFPLHCLNFDQQDLIENIRRSIKPDASRRSISSYRKKIQFSSQLVMSLVRTIMADLESKTDHDDSVVLGKLNQLLVDN